ncbi:MAG: hypothetical protein JJ992_19255, partial [Planctomycetes bacterium]|nr:hypothetical protein [Planctomycetota bacterium]
MKISFRALAGPVFVLCIMVGALWLLHSELRQYHLRDFIDAMAAIPASRIVLAIFLTALNYMVLIGYDVLGVRYIGHPMSLRRIALASFVGYALG